jgi:hypothetical protein
MTRRTFVAGSLAAAAPASGVATQGAGPHLFLDDTWIESQQGIARSMHRPEKYLANPVLTRTEPWERRCVTASGSVLYDEAEGLFKCWYQTYDQLVPVADRVRFCYAVSKDGIYWQKPKLGFSPFEGSRDNNIVLTADEGILDSPIVIHDPLDRDPQRRYKMIFYLGAKGEQRGLYAATSADGVRWRRLPGPVIRSGDRSSFFWNPLRRKYTVLTRPGFLNEKTVPAPGTGVLRWVGLWESDDFEHFGEMHPVIWPDSADGEGAEFYSLQPFAWGPQAVGYLEMFYMGAKDPRYRRLNIQLVSSRDGRDWTRALDRKVFLQYGPLGSWDGGWVCPTSNPPIRVKDRLYIFFHGRQSLHWGTQPYSFEQNGETYVLNDPKVGHVGAIGLATLRVDGFCSLDAASQPGRLQTRAFAVQAGQRLLVNARAEGSLRAAVLDHAGLALPGFGMSDCRAFRGDSIEHVVAWSGGNALPRAGTVKVRFELENASLFSLAFR